MIAPHSLDLTRLELLRQQFENARAAATGAHQTALEAHRQVGVAHQELRRYEEISEAGIMTMDRRQLSAKRTELREKVQKLEAEKIDLFDKYQVLSERGRALGTLYSRCAEFVGVDPNAR